MKKLCAILMIALITGCASIKKNRVHVDDSLRAHFNTLDSIYSSQGVRIDYSQIDSVLPITRAPIPDASILEGLYIKETKNLYVNTNQLMASLHGVYNEYVTVILAHEMAHSQGKYHSVDPNSIMYPNSRFLPTLIKLRPLSDLVISPYVCGCD